MRAKLFLVGLVVSLLVVGQAVGQGHKVSGRVIASDDRAPLLGANIVVKNTDKGTSTDNDGQYVLESVSPQDTLVFMFIGYQREEIPIGGQQVLDIVMTPEAIAGEELVVTGYGTQLRRDVTTAISSLDEHAFTQGAISDPQTLLQARIPGVQVSQSSGQLGAAPLIRIRGGTSVSASNQPLIVIDGIPIDNTSPTPAGDANSGGNVTGGNTDNILGSLNPYDIASVDVLKDAAAAAIYGARGGNGVILITTKQGRAGGFSLTYDGYTTMATQSKKLDLLSAQEYRDFAAKLGANPPLGSANTDWQDAVNRTGVSQNHNIAFSSGNANTQYRVSLSYLDEEGVVKGSNRKRFSGRLNINHKMLDDKLRLAVRINPSYVKKDNIPYQQDGGFEGGTFTNVFKMNPTDPVREDDGSFFVFAGNPTGIRNPVALVSLVQDEQKSQRIFANATAEYEVLPGLSGKINAGFDRTTVTRKQFQPNSIPYAASFGGRADNRENEQRTSTLETTVNYRRNIGASQTLEVWGGYTFQEFELSGFHAAALDFVTDAFSFNNLAAGANTTVRPESFQEKSRLISFLGRVNYNIKDKYLFSAAIRREGSSRFGSGKKWGSFPSVSAAWRLSEEPFMRGFESLSDLKLRLSFGVTGNQDIGNFKSLVLLGPGANAVIGGQTLTGVSAIQLANPDLQWEETDQVDGGIDFGLFNNRISGSIDYYSKTTDNLLLTFAVPQPAVVANRIDNAGKVTNKGLEITLNTVNISTGDLFWRTNFNFASNRNNVVSLGERDFIIHSRVSGAGLSDVDALIILPGHPLGTFFGPRFLGYDADGNEILSTDPNRPESSTGPLHDGRQILGDAQPDFTLGISNSINYKRLDFRFYFQGVVGFSVLNNTRLEYQRPSNVFNGINLFAGAVKDVENGLGPTATVAYSDRFIENASYLRLQNVTLGYTVNPNWIRNLRVRNLRLYVSADNLFVLTGYDGYDPEVNTFVQGVSSEGVAGVPSIGIDYTNYPRSRTFSFGVNLGL
ncbi:MAG: SusC/RagA family TonB-linked outer membrane protein [bacterium]